MHDIAVIGGGPGGYVAAIRGAQQGLSVLLVEKEALGGTCLNRGCIPTKSFVYDTRLLASAKLSPVLTGNESLTIDALKMLNRKRLVVTNMVDGLGKIIKSNGIDFVPGRGELTAPGRIRVTNDSGRIEAYSARHVILATGSRPAVPPVFKLDEDRVLTTDQALDSEILPKDIVIIGGGVIGVEMATIYLNAGCSVTIVEMLPDILATEDPDLRGEMLRLLQKNNARVFLGARVTGTESTRDGVKVFFEDESGTSRALETERVLVATGRSPVLDGINASKLGLEMNGPFVMVDAHMRTNLPGTYAIGDIVGGMMLAHKASAEAEVAVEHILGKNRTINPQLIPRCIWGLAEIGAVGLNEDEAKTLGRKIKVGKFPYMASGAAQAMGNSEGFVKIIGDAETGEILGVHILGEHATDMISEAITAMRMEGAVEDLFEAIKPHPTVSETVAEAAMDWNGMAIHLPRR